MRLEGGTAQAEPRAEDHRPPLGEGPMAECAFAPGPSRAEMPLGGKRGQAAEPGREAGVQEPDPWCSAPNASLQWATFAG
jgi:hypothetical protein